VFDAVVDDQDEEAAGLVIEGVAVFLLVDDMVGRDALDGVEKGRATSLAKAERLATDGWSPRLNEG
jgi:hypothetical protein